MGLAVRVIPTLLCKGEHLVKGRQFSADRVVGHVQQAARIHQARGVDELIVLDVTATKEGRGPNIEAVERLTSACFMPLTVGGGVRDLADVSALLRAGADKVAVCTFAQERPSFIRECAARYGSQAIVASVDVRDPGWPCTRCGTIQWHVCGALVLARGFANDGAGEILLTSIDREGTMQGYDIETIKAVSDAVDIPVIAHGGCSGPEDMLKAIEAGASAVAAGALFQFTDWTPKACSQWLLEHGVEARV